MTGAAQLRSALSGAAAPQPGHWVDALLRCPRTGEALMRDGGGLVARLSGQRYSLTPENIPLFAEQFCTAEARVQQAHYEKIAQIYVTNLGYPHTQVYMKYLDDVLLESIAAGGLGITAEICCGAGEAFQLVGDQIEQGIGIDISPSMLRAAQSANTGNKFAFVQGDATMLPIGDGCIDNVFMLGGIHHVSDRARLFGEVARVLKPGGRFYFREPVSDFWLWRVLRSIIYRLSPTLDHETERPLLHAETEPHLTQAGMRLQSWRTAGFLGFCFFMNSDVLVFNRLLRFIPGIKMLTALAVKLDDWTVRLPMFNRAGLQVIGVAQKPAGAAI